MLKSGLDVGKLRGIGTDGVATMTSCHIGVVFHVTPSAIGVHYEAHRLNVVAVQAADSIPYVKNLEAITVEPSCSK